MKKGIFLIMIFALFAISANYKSNQVTQYFVQFKVNTISENSQAMVVDQHMNTVAGVDISRTDYITSTYFCVLSPGISYSETDFTTWFEDLGFSISCYYQGIQNVDNVISPNDLKDCQND